MRMQRSMRLPGRWGSFDGEKESLSKHGRRSIAQRERDTAVSVRIDAGVDEFCAA
jgi:hypothetical protein